MPNDTNPSLEGEINFLSPKVNTNKVFATVGIILTVAIVVIGSLWIYLNFKGANKVDLDDSVKVTSVKTATKAAETSTTKDETAGWKTYTSKSLGFSIKYPEDNISHIFENQVASTLLKDGTQTEFSTKEAEAIKQSGIIVGAAKSGSLNSYDYDKISSYEIGNENVVKPDAVLTETIVRLSNLKIDDKDALRQTWVTNNSGTLNYGYDILAKHGDSYFGLRISIYKKDVFDNEKAILDLMATTFKFL